MVINRSVFGQAPFSISISIVGITLILLFTAMEPETSAGLDFWPRLLFWTAQVTVTFIGILIASVLIRRFATTAISDIWLILFTGILTSIIVSPAFLLIENFFPGLERIPDGILDEIEQTGIFAAIIVQSIEAMPEVTISWFVVNLPILLHSTFINHNHTGNDPGSTPPEPPQQEQPPGQQNHVKQDSERAQFILKLPENIGSNIMYVSSDLHYLKVTTEKGTVLVLGSIARFADAFEEDGFLVHRSHWVHKDYVTRVIISGNSAHCLMQDGNCIPISRSKRKLLKAYFGNNNTSNTNNLVELASLKQKP